LGLLDIVKTDHTAWQGKRIWDYSVPFDTQKDLELRTPIQLTLDFCHVIDRVSEYFNG